MKTVENGKYIWKREVPIINSGRILWHWNCLDWPLRDIIMSITINILLTIQEQWFHGGSY